MMVLDRFAVLVQKLLSTNGRLLKEEYLGQFAGDSEVLEILKFLFNPYIVTGISDKKLLKVQNMNDLPLFNLCTQQGSGDKVKDFLEVLEYFKKNNTGRDEDVRYLIRVAKSTNHCELIYSIIKKDLKLGIQNTTLNKVFGADFVPKPEVMLAHSYADYSDHIVDKEFIITEKLDGIRCILIFEPSPAFFSRNGQPILDLVELNEQVMHLPTEFVYDGELLLNNPRNFKSEDLYRATVKITNSDSVKKGLIFNVFDMIDKQSFLSGIDAIPCIDRKSRFETVLEDLHKQNLCKNIKAVPMQYVGHDVNKITELLQQFTDLGGEGIMVNIASAPYECKRTKNLLKVKQFNSADVLVVDIEEGTGANRGKLGAVIVRFIAPDGKQYTCRVGSGFKLDERELYWKEPDLIRNKIIEIGYFELSRNQNDDNYSLRFPTFKHLRNDKTEISMH